MWKLNENNSPIWITNAPFVLIRCLVASFLEWTLVDIMFATVVFGPMWSRACKMEKSIV